MNWAEIKGRCSAGIDDLRRSASPLPRLSWPAWAADAVLAVVLAWAAANSARLRGQHAHAAFGPDGVPIPGPFDVPHYGVTEPWHLVLAAMAVLPLVLRRRFPLTTFWAVICLSQLYHLSPGFDAEFTLVASVIAAYSATTYSPHRILALASAFAGTVLVVAFHNQDLPASEPGIVTLLLLIPIGLAVNAIQTWKQRVRTMAAEHQAATRLAVQRERSRIARELHDVVTHNVSVMVAQAGAARTVLGSAPDQAREALLSVEAGGRAAMTELRQVMGLLTTPDDGVDPADLAPQPGLGQVTALVDRMRATGVVVDLTVTGAPGPLPPGVDLVVYRVVQEALTNTMKHAAGASVSVAVTCSPREVRVDVADTGGTSAATPDARAGRGLIGLKERLAVHGGTLEFGARLAGGYRLLAVLPVEDSRYGG